MHAVMRLEEATNDIAADVEFARIALQGGLVVEIIPTTVEVYTDAVVGLDDVGGKDLQLNSKRLVTTVPALTSNELTTCGTMWNNIPVVHDTRSHTCSGTSRV
jgi:hypothetical protein